MFVLNRAGKVAGVVGRCKNEMLAACATRRDKAKGSGNLADYAQLERVDSAAAANAMYALSGQARAAVTDRAVPAERTKGLLVTVSHPANQFALTRNPC